METLDPQTPSPSSSSSSSSSSTVSYSKPPNPSFQNQNPSPMPPSLTRLWRPAAQRNLRNQWSKLVSCRKQWVSSSSSGKSHATSLVNAHLSQRYLSYTFSFLFFFWVFFFVCSCFGSVFIFVMWVFCGFPVCVWVWMLCSACLLRKYGILILGIDVLAKIHLAPFKILTVFNSVF